MTAADHRRAWRTLRRPRWITLARRALAWLLE